MRLHQISSTLLIMAVTVPIGAHGGIATAAEAVHADFFVATDGNDAWSGKLDQPNDTGTDGPFATLVRARDAVRQLKTDGGRDIVVLIRGGTYRLTDTVVFSLKDSANDDQTITYAAYPKERPIFSSGRAVGKWRRVSESLERLPKNARPHVWAADVSAFGTFRSLFDSKGALPRARGEGFSQTNNTPRGSQDYQTVQFPAGIHSQFARITDVELRIIPSHFWIMNLLPIASIDSATRTIHTAVPGTYPLGRNGMTDRNTAWFENALELLDEPGEWVLDTTDGLLYLWPRGDQLGNDIEAPTLTELIRVEGRIDFDGPVDQPVHGLIFKGLTFAHGDRFPWQGRTGRGLQHDWECFDQPTALFRFRGAERCDVEDCEFSDSGHAAIRLDLHCQDIRVVGNHIHHIGGVGVLLQGYGPGTKNVNRKNTVSNNYIHHIGQQYWGSSAIFAWQSGENQIAHNQVDHTPYTAIVATGRISKSKPGPGECSRTIRWNETPEAYLQWSWKEREPYLHSRKNVIEYNDIHHSMETLGDGNCIYVSGAGGGNIVRHNYCHHCYGEYMNAVIRCDDDQHETLMEGNVCFQTGGYGEGFISKGDNDIINNVIADLQPVGRHRGYIVFPYGDIQGTTIERNILFSCRKNQTLYYHSHGSGRGREIPRLSDARVDRNVYFCTRDAGWADALLQTQHKNEAEQHSVQADPLFVDMNGGDFRFQPDSPAAKLGIQPIDVRQAGLEPDYQQRLLGRILTTRISPPARVLDRPTKIRIVCSEAGAEIRYTLDGTNPVQTSPLYQAPFVLDHATTVRARSFAAGANDLVEARVTYLARPQPIVEDFESISIGATVPNATTSEDDRLKQYTARISDAQATSGKHSLRFSDGPGQKQAFSPHVYYRCRFDEGRLIGRFDIRIDAATSMYYQWRQYDTNYKSGPTITIVPGGVVTYKSKKLLTIPIDRWVRFEVVCDVGDRANGTFQLRVWPDGEKNAREFDLPIRSGFDRLDWFGFISKSEKDAVYYVDNITTGPVTH